VKKLVVCAIALAVMFGAAHAQTPRGDAAKSGVDVLSDTMGVDFDPYVRRVHNDLLHNWAPLIPAEVLPPVSKKGIVSIRFTILPDGKIGSMKIEYPSGDPALDKAAWSAVTGEGQFPALPSEFHGPSLELRVSFFYNIAPTRIPVNKQ
jgi:TonB family protein